MAVSITNFSQLARERDQRIRDRMHGLCPRTAALGDRLTVRPVELSEIPAAPTSNVQADLDRRTFAADLIKAQNNQALIAILGQACAQEMLTGQDAVLPPFLRETP